MKERLRSTGSFSMTELRSQLPARNHWAGVPEAREALPRDELLRP